ncbi:hypothetical protein, partial [Leptospira interrogans]|uniref:hypothetical protein n=4 Tax=Leptospira interrogans TaxID=173 RepID=UPI00233F09CC
MPILRGHSLSFPSRVQTQQNASYHNLTHKYCISKLIYQNYNKSSVKLSSYNAIHKRVVLSFKRDLSSANRSE